MTSIGQSSASWKLTYCFQISWFGPSILAGMIQKTLLWPHGRMNRNLNVRRWTSKPGGFGVATVVTDFCSINKKWKHIWPWRNNFFLIFYYNIFQQYLRKVYSFEDPTACSPVYLSYLFYKTSASCRKKRMQWTENMWKHYMSIKVTLKFDYHEKDIGSTMPNQLEA